MDKVNSLDTAAVKEIIVRPWAKINLFLKILGRRADGYHELLTFIHPIALFDELAIRRIDNGFVLRCSSEDLPFGQDISSSEDNLVSKAVKLFFGSIEKEPSVEINLIKRIPIGGGLGGGSSDAASALTGLNRLFGNPLDFMCLCELGMKLGMDVPFFLESKPAICRGRGEIIEKRCDNIEFWSVLVNPGKNLSTQSVYESLNLTLTGKETADIISVFEKKQDIDYFIEYINNDLEKPAINLCPEIGDIVKLFGKLKVLKSFVCGSGSTVCGLARNKSEAEEVSEKIRAEGRGSWWCKVVRSL